MKQKLFDTNNNVSHGGRVEDYWMTRVMHPKYAQEEAKNNNEVDMVAILKKYNVKGFEFGNWVNQNDRYDFVHAFLRSAQILSEIVGSKNIGLDLLLGVAFGARGRGGAAIVHYEPHHNMINLTRDKSYGCLAHEWGHAIDYNLGRHIDQNKDYAYLTGGHSIAMILPTNTGAQLRMWANAVIDEAKATPSFKRIEEADEYWHRRTEVWARFFEQYVAYQCKLKKKSPRFLSMTFEEYTKSKAYWTEEDFKKIARGSMFSFMAVLKGVLNNRYTLTACPYKYKTRDMLYTAPGKQIKPKYALPLYVVAKGRKPSYDNMLCFNQTEIKDGKVYYIGRSVNATPKELYRHTPEEKVTADYDRVLRATAERIIREAKEAKKTKRAASKTGKKKEPIAAKTAKAPTIKPLENFVLTKTGELCMAQDVTSKWGSDNVKTWKRIYLVRLYDDDKSATIEGRFLIGLKNGQYYFGDTWGHAAFELCRGSEEWNKFMHPAGATKPAVRKVGLDYSEYSFRDQNEAFYFAERTHKRKVVSRMDGVNSKAFGMLISDIYESEYMYAKFPSRRLVSPKLWTNGEKPQAVKTITKK